MVTMPTLRASAIFDLSTGQLVTLGTEEIIDRWPEGTKINLAIIGRPMPGNYLSLNVCGVKYKKPKCGYDCPNVPFILGNPVTAIKVKSRFIKAEVYGNTAVAQFHIYADGTPNPAGWYTELRVVDYYCKTYSRVGIFGGGYTYYVQLSIMPAPPPGTYRLYLEAHGQWGPWWFCLARTEIFVVIPPKEPNELTIEKFAVGKVELIGGALPYVEPTSTVEPGMVVVPIFIAELDSPLPRDGTLHVKFGLDIEELGRHVLVDTSLKWPKGTKKFNQIPLDKLATEVPNLGGEPNKKYSGKAFLTLALTW